MYRNVLTEMSPDQNGQTETARPISPVPCDLTVIYKTSNGFNLCSH